MKFLEGVGLQV